MFETRCYLHEPYFKIYMCYAHNSFSAETQKQLAWETKIADFARLFVIIISLPGLFL